jgi:ubiquinone/menaquinone biosynthesis C-methylase UbiE
MTAKAKEGGHFDTRWESGVYGQGRQLNRFPHMEVVSFVFGALAGESAAGRVALDIGCGAGNNAVFLAQAGFDLLAVDGSESAVRVARERLAEAGLQGRVWVGDFTRLADVADASVDLVVDRCAICHCRRTGMALALDEVRRVLKPGGRFFSQLFSDTHGELRNATEWHDGAATGFSGGYFADIAQTCFASAEDVATLYAGRFRIERQDLVITTAWPSRDVASAHWNLWLRQD